MTRRWLHAGLVLVIAGCGEVQQSTDAGRDARPPDMTVKPDSADRGPEKDILVDGLVDARDGGDGPGKCGNNAIDVGEDCDGLNLNKWTCKAKGYDGGELKCDPQTCLFDKSGCHKCSDGNIDTGELCDGANLNKKTCKSEGFNGGTLACSKNCKTFDTTACYTCGDAKIDSGEQCDGVNLGGKSCKSEGFAAGTLKCAPKCMLDKSHCTMCGNGKLDSGEQCDGTNLSGKSCKSEGFDGGTLSCSITCKLDKGKCTSIKCGDGKLESPEDCEPKLPLGKTCKALGYTAGVLACNSNNCTFDSDGCYRCGDHAINPGEDCDGVKLGGTCLSLKYDGGQLACGSGCMHDTSGCYKCGDTKKNGTEQCDGKDLASKACSGVGFYAGSLGCKVTCTFDTAKCHNCGNAKVDSGEECDGANLGKQDCKALGFDGGTLKCSSACKLDKSGCTLVKCGDGKVEGKEQCDKTDLGGKTCTSLSYAGGKLACTANCKLDAAGCYKCGDGKINGSETCDGAALAGKSCASFSLFHSGTLKCNSSCSDFDKSGCNRCGDGKVNGTEKCDGTLLGAATCKSLGFDGGTLKCSSCTYDAASCHKCGDGKVSGAESCDGAVPAGASCQSQGFDGGGTLKCSTLCALDSSGCTRVPRQLSDEHYIDFKQGTLSESGAKIYVSARGNVQLVDRLDLNNDGNLDIVICNGRQTSGSYKNNSYVYWGPGFSTKKDLTTFGCSDTAQADLNDDGYPDVVFANGSNDTNGKTNSYVYWGSATGFVSKTELPGMTATKTAVADIDGDGFLDIVICNHWDTTYKIKSYVYHGTQTGISTARRLALDTVGCSGVAIADVNKDGDLDIVFANTRGPTSLFVKSYVYLGPKFAVSSRLELPTAGARGVSVADLGTPDGHLDIVFNNHDIGSTHKTNSYLYWGPKFTTKTELPTLGASSVSVARIGTGNALDIVFGNGYDDKNWQINSYVYRGPTYATRLDIPTVGVGGNTVADFTGDGKLDIVFNNTKVSTNQSASTYLYMGPSPFSTKVTLASTFASSSGSSDPGSVYDRKPTQTFTSRIHDSGISLPEYATLSWKATVPAKTSLRLQLRSATKAAGIAAAVWYGPTSTSDSYDLSKGSSVAINATPHKGHRHIQYRATFEHDHGNTPVLDRVEIKFHNTSTCSTTSCTDKAKNGCETDVDCGGDVCARCLDGKGCKAGSDCLSGVCGGGVCKTGCVHQPVVRSCRTDNLGLEWCRIPSGCYMMGSPSTEVCRHASYETQHQVTLTRTFEMLATEVTQKQFQAVISSTPSHFSSCGTSCPVEGVHWHQAAAFCNELSKKHGKTPCYSCSGSGSARRCQEATGATGKDIYACPGYRLPTEAEWEYGYRAGTTSAYYNGQGDWEPCAPCSSNATGIHQLGWSCANSKVSYSGCSMVDGCSKCVACRGTNPVKSKLPNGWGLYDMAGNTWEWCHDANKADLGSSKVVDPVTSGSSTASRMIRGGAWDQYRDYLRASYRSWYLSTHQPNSYGFRCVRSLDP